MSNGNSNRNNNDGEAGRGGDDASTRHPPPSDPAPDAGSTGTKNTPPNPGDIDPEAVRLPAKMSPPADVVTDDLDPEAIRLDPQYARGTVTRREQLAIPVDKPNKQTFFRVHPDMHIDVCLLANQSDGKLYLVLRAAQDAVEESELKYATLYPWVDRDGNFGFWPAGLPYADGTSYAAWDSVHEICSRAKKAWVRHRWNRAIGAYDVITLDASIVVDEPQFPTDPLPTLLGRAFAGRVIKTADHPMIRRLLGKA